MKRTFKQKVLSIVMCIAVLGTIVCNPTPVLAEVDYDTYDGIQVSEVPVLPEQEVHPSLRFSTADIQNIKTKRNLDAYSLQLWNEISGSSYLAMAVPKVEDIPKATDSSDTVHKYYGNMSRIAKYNAFMFLMNGNQTYKTKAIEALKRAFDGPIYDMDATVSSSGVDEIYRASWVQNFAEAYDWIQPYLTAAEDTLIRANLIREARVTYENLYTWGPRPHNHLSKPAWGLGTLALVLSEEPEASSWLARALKAANMNTRYFFNEDGLYREGAHYYIYSLLNLVPFLYHYKNVSGVNLFPAYQPIFEWAVEVRNGKGWMPNIEDSWIKPTPLHIVASEYKDAATILHSTAKLGNILQWSYFNTDFGPWMPEMSYTGASSDDTWDLEEFLTYDPSIAQIQPDCSPTLFNDKSGQTMFRNNWNVNDPSSRYLLFQGVAEADNHYHYDHLSFIIQAENQMMASDAGYSRDSYGEDIRTSWYLTAEAHNVITANGIQPMDTAQNTTPVSRYNLDTDFFDFQEKEAVYNGFTIPEKTSYDFSGKQVRAIAFPGQDYFVVADQLSSSKQVQYDLYLHGGRGAMTGSGNYRLWTYSDDRYGDAAKMASWTFPSNKSVYIDKMGEVNYEKGMFGSFGYLNARQIADSAMFMQILVPLGKDDAIPQVTDLSSGSTVGGTVVMDGSRDTYLQQLSNTESQLAGVKTDATFAYARAAASTDKISQYSVRQGTKLDYSGSNLFTSSSPVTFALDVSDIRQYKGALSDTVPTELRIKSPVGAPVQGVTINGTPVSFTENAGYTVFEAAGGEIVLNFGEGAVPSATVLTGTAKDSHVGLSWQPVEGAESYIVKRGTDAADLSEIAVLDGTSYTDYEAVNGTTYYYSVSATNLFGEGQPSNILAAKPAAAVKAPGTPANVKAVPGPGSITLTWNESDNAYAYEVKYEAKQGFKIDGQPVTVTVQGTECFLSGLDSAKTYYLTVTAINSKGRSRESRQVRAVPNPVPVTAPQNVTAQSGSGSVLISWDKVENADSYIISRSETGSNYAVIAQNVETNVFTDTGLTNGKYYYYTVTAVSPTKQSAVSNIIMASPAATGGFIKHLVQGNKAIYIDAEHPAIMSGFAYTGSDEASGGQYMKSSTAGAKLVYEVNMKASGTYDLFLRTTGRAVDLKVTVNGTASRFSNRTRDWEWDKAVSGAYLNAGRNLIEIENLGSEAGIDQLALSSGSFFKPVGESNVSLTPVMGLGQPLNLSGSYQNHQVSLTWAQLPGADSYNIKRSRTEGEGFQSIAVNVRGTSFTDTNTYPGVTYYYAVSTNSASGESPDSNAIAVQTVVSSQTLYPTDDTYVENKSTTVNTNFASATQLKFKGSPNGTDDRVSYMKFDISGFGGEIGSAVLQVQAKTNSSTETYPPMPLSVHGLTNDDWLETELTWNNSPNHEVANCKVTGLGDTATLLGDVTVEFGVYKDLTLDITDYVKNHADNSDGIVALMFSDQGESAAYGWIRSTGESNQAYHPKLILTAASGGVVLPETPSKVHLVSGDKVNTLTWQPAAGIDSYTVQRSINGYAFETVAENLTEAVYADQHVVNGITYYYKVTAIRNNQKSDSSGIVSGTPVSPAANNSEKYIVETFPAYMEAENYMTMADNAAKTVDDAAFSGGKGILLTGILGDVDGDGVLTLNDTKLILEMFMGLRPNDLRADVTGEGKINREDVNRIIQYLREKNYKFRGYGEYVEYKLSAPTAGAYTLWISGTADGKGDIGWALNGASRIKEITLGSELRFINAGTVQLNAGDNTLRIYATEDAGVRLDKLALAPEGFDPNTNGGTQAAALEPVNPNAPMDVTDVQHKATGGKLTVSWTNPTKPVDGIAIYQNGLLLAVLGPDATSFELDGIGYNDYYELVLKTINEYGEMSQGVTIQKEIVPFRQPVVLNVAAVSNSTNDGNIPENVLDRDLATRWAALSATPQEAQWLQLDLGEAKEVGYLGIAVNKGDTRKSIVEIRTSLDDIAWETVYSGTSSGTTADLEPFAFNKIVSARYIQILGYGYNNLDGSYGKGWNSFSEVQVYAPNPAGTIVIPVNFGPLTVAGVSDSANDGNIPENTIDGDMTTRWASLSASETDAQWICYDLGEAKQVGYLGIAVNNGDQRMSKIDIQLSLDGNSWQSVYSGLTSGTTKDLEAYAFEPAQARYVRILGYGYYNLSGTYGKGWNSFYEVQIYAPNEIGPLLSPPVKSNSQPTEPIDVTYTQPGFINPDGTVHEIPTPNPVTGITVNVADYGADPADNANDDRLAIQRAIDAAKAGDEIYFPNGVYNLNTSTDTTSHLGLKSGVNLRGESKDGVLLVSNFTDELNATQSTRVLRILGLENIAIRNMTITSTFDGAYSTDHNVNNPDAGGPLYGIYIQDLSNKPSRNITIEDVTVEKFQRMAIRIASSYDVVVRRVLVKNATDLGGGGAGYGITIQGAAAGLDRKGYNNDSRYNLVEDCVFEGPYVRHGVILQYYTHNNVIRNNVLTMTKLDALDLHGEDEYLNEIYGNEIHDVVTGAGIAAGNTGATHDKSGPGNYIHDNTVINCREGVKVHLGSPDTVIENNIIINSTVADGKGIYLQNAPGTIIRGNQIHDNQGEGFWGIVVEHDPGDSGNNGNGAGDPDNVLITGNAVYANTNGVKITAGTNITVKDNDIRDNLVENYVNTVGGSEPEPAEILSVIATENALVDKAAPDTAWAVNDNLKPKRNSSGSTAKIAYVKFNIAGLVPEAKEISGGTLRLKATFGTVSSSSPGTAVYNVYGLTDDSWTQAGITWNTSPNHDPLDSKAAGDAVLLGSITLVDERDAAGASIEKEYTLDIDDFVKQHGDTALTFMILDETGYNSNVNIRSVSKGEAAAPRLDVEVIDAKPVINPVVLTASENTVVDKSNPDLVWATNDNLKPKRSGTGGTSRIAYIKFVADGIVDKAEVVTSAAITLTATFGTGATTATYNIYGLVDDSWTQTAATWNNTPNHDPADSKAAGTGLVLLGSITFVNEVDAAGVSIQKAYTLDVTEFVKTQNDGVLTFMILDETGYNANVNIRSINKAEAAPKLSIQ